MVTGSPTAAILSVGTEIVRGDLEDTNAPAVARILVSLGYVVDEVRAVPDQEEALAGAFRDLLGGHHLVVSTGGLGPTADDLTRQCLADALNVDLVEDAAALAAIRAFFDRRGILFTPNNRRQAVIPRGAIAVFNPVGTAPGILWRDGGRTALCLPGPPPEWKPMLGSVRDVLSRVAREQGLPVVAARDLFAVGVGESRAEWVLSSLALPPSVTASTYCTPGEVRIRVEARAGDEGMARHAVEQAITEIGGALGEHLLDPAHGNLLSSLAVRLRASGLTLAVAESCTGGLVGHLVTSVAGSSDFFLGGVVAYDNRVKESVLGVPPHMIAAAGAVSEDVARSMARGVRSALGAGAGVGVTGIAGPGGASPEKPVGTCFIAISTAWGDHVRHVHGGLDRSANKLLFARMALVALHSHLKEVDI